MKAYKGFNENLTSVMGDGKKETCVFRLGETKRVESSKTIRSGFHCCEYPFDCLRYYALNGKNRFFVVEAAGDIDEDDHRIACTEITIMEELDTVGLAYEGMKYMLDHQYREGWEINKGNVVVAKDEAEIKGFGIAIARGADPMVKAPKGAVCGLYKENTAGDMIGNLFIVGAGQADKWLKLDKHGEVEVI